MQAHAASLHTHMTMAVALACTLYAQPDAGEALLCTACEQPTLSSCVHCYAFDVFTWYLCNNMCLLAWHACAYTCVCIYMRACVCRCMPVCLRPCTWNHIQAHACACRRWSISDGSKACGASWQSERVEVLTLCGQMTLRRAL